MKIRRTFSEWVEDVNLQDKLQKYDDARKILFTERTRLLKKDSLDSREQDNLKAIEDRLNRELGPAAQDLMNELTEALKNAGRHDTNVVAETQDPI